MSKPRSVAGGSLLRRMRRLWDYETGSLWVWVPLWALAILLFGGFLS